MVYYRIGAVGFRRRMRCILIENAIVRKNRKDVLENDFIVAGISDELAIRKWKRAVRNTDGKFAMRWIG